jgi:hypothetical protein
MMKRGSGRGNTGSAKSPLPPAEVPDHTATPGDFNAHDVCILSVAWGIE